MHKLDIAKNNFSSIVNLNCFSNNSLLKKNTTDFGLIYLLIWLVFNSNNNPKIHHQITTQYYPGCHQNILLWTQTLAWFLHNFTRFFKISLTSSLSYDTYENFDGEVYVLLKWLIFISECKFVLQIQIKTMGFSIGRGMKALASIQIFIKPVIY